MKLSAQNKHKNFFVTAGLLAVTTVFLSFSSGAIAQSANNPFVPALINETEKPSTVLDPESVLYDQTDATKTIAQDQIALTAIPPRLGDDGSLKVLPGEKIQVQIRVRNISEQPVFVVTSAQDFILDQDGETPISIDDSGSNRWSLASWLTLTPTEHKINSKSTVGINVLIDVPADALPGGHYAMILHEPGNGSQDEELSLNANNESNTAINQRVGTLLYVVVDGLINEEAYIRDFDIPKFTEYGPLNFDFVVENNSDIHITPQMSVEIFNIFNQKVETIPIEPKNIFPLANRSFDGQWDRVWGWGLYKAKLTMSYGTSGSIVVANSSFWLLPITIILAVAALLLIFLFILIAIKRHLNHRRDMEEQHILDLESKIQNLESQGDRE
jgi:hypothetical protein